MASSFSKLNASRGLAKFLKPETLVCLVESRPCLWDQSDPSFKNQITRIAAWREVCSHFYTGFDELEESEKTLFIKFVTRRWTYLRDAWRKSIMDACRAKRTGKHRRPYVYSEQMKFLLKNEVLLQQAEESADGSLLDDEYIQETYKQDDFTRMHRRKNKRKSEEMSSYEALDSDSESSDEKMGKVQKVEEEQEVASEIVFVDNHTLDSEDRNLMFFRVLLPSLKTLTDDQTLDFHAGVINLLRDIKKNGSVGK